MSESGIAATDRPEPASDADADASAAPAAPAPAAPGPAAPGPAATEPAATEPARTADPVAPRPRSRPTRGDDGDATGRPAATGRRDRGPAVLAALALAWLAATLWSAQALISGAVGGVAVNRAAIVLPSIIAAGLVAGVAVGLAAPDAARRFARGTTGRLAVGAAAGLATGAVVAGLVLAGYGTSSPIIVLAAAMAAAQTLGGLLGAALRPAALAGAAVAGALGWFAVGLLQGAFRGSLLELFGAGDDAESQWRASTLLLFTAAVLGGLLAGVLAYRYVARRSGGVLRWPAYLAAGAGAGALMLVADLITRVGGAQLLAAAASTSAADRVGAQLRASATFDTGLILLFVGGITAMIAFGRTLGRRDR
jgi:hypothetical protein